MKNVFPIIRGVLLGVVAAWTLIVLGIAIHFQTSFVDSAAELTYVSLAVFVAAVTLALFLVVLVAPCNKLASNILRTKWELVWLGALAVLWTALAGYTTSPAAKDNEVECWDEDENGNVVETNVDGYSNDVYLARYRVLQAFAFFNCILLLFLFLFILVLAFWHHKRGRYVIWTTPTTSVGWFDRPTGKGTAHGARTLPPPITHRKSHKDERYEKWDNEKEVGSGRKRGFTFDDAENKVKDKFRSLKTRVGAHDSDKEEKAIEKMDLIQKPSAAARKPLPPIGGKPAVTRSNSTPLKPRQYVVGVPAGEATKPALAPIAAKMTEERRKAADEPKRQPSQRERMDRERQAARRERDDSDEREGRHAYRGIGNVQDVTIKRSGSVPAGVAVDGGRKEGRRRDGSRDVTRPDVVRSGSGAKASGARPSRQEGESSGSQTKNPYRQTSGRKA